MYSWYINSWIDVIQSAKKELTKNWPEDMKTASDAFLDAQSKFAKDAFKATTDFHAAFNGQASEALKNLKTLAEESNNSKS